MLRKARDRIYRGHLRQAVRHTGLNNYLSGPYWKLVYRLSNNIQGYTVSNQTAKFKINNYTEFIRFRDLSGEESILEDLLCSLEPDDIVYDVGANVGTYTCFIASKLGPGQIVAFEPEPQNVDRLRENIKLNNTDANVIDIALSDSDGTIDLSLSGNEAGEGEHMIATDQETETIEVKMARGDTIIDRHGLPNPTVMKIDVEGAEMLVLRGLSETFRNHVRLAYIEVHPEKLPKFGDSASEVHVFLEESGFDVTKISSRGSEFFLRASR
ncbi:hypothetical protein CHINAEXTREME_14335 [Halobiforma lacisalsi AJ5]|uniref:Methyltransferase FkbM domain-containing protein n=1 Tax=Natronobacterium lacisalsi AJ5 TaxID=358396 RepID=M0L2A7_NATLA|nr:hypothetical protein CHINAEXTREME_14335 [Halobiforma lacisalsi AJ5]EMA27233.1 hypothetical protein C445_21071 [Halobiforma lacisalsi AJ5]